MLSRYLPPMFDVGGKRADRFARHLPSFGWQPHVLTAPLPPDRPLDPSARPLPEGVVLERELMPRWWPQPRNRPSDATVATPIEARQPGRLAKLSRQFMLPVGEEILLAPRTVARMRKRVHEAGIDVIFATSAPYATLVHGAALARATGKPLVLDLRDPWTLNFLQENRPRWVREVEARIEARLFARADRVILTCAAAAEAYRARFPALAAKIVTITNAFEPRELAYEPRHDRLTLIHFGNCYGARTLAPVLHALAWLREQGRLDPREVVIRNLGRIGRADLELAASLGLTDQLEHETAVPYEQGLAELARADLLLLLSYGREQLFLPAKLFDYMAAGAPILCVAPPSELTEIVAATRIGQSCDPDDVEGCAEIIMAAADRRRGASEEPLRDPSGAALEPYTARATTAALARLLDELV
jgi:glycosyltransferase involved in cell wall biosynthesis